LWDVDTGREVELDGPPLSYSWTADSRLFGADTSVWPRGYLVVCETDGSCEKSALSIPEPTGDEFLRLAGQTYES
jgi:hypothetical protein